MRITSTLFLVLLSALVMGLASCSDKKEEWVATEPVSDYLPLAVGKYITYRVDSLVPNVLFNATLDIHSYQIKHVVDAEVTDNLGRPSYRIFRFKRNADGSGPWETAGSYFITPLTNQVELVETNLRYIKLREPIREGFSWRGNAYLPVSPFQALGYNMTVANSMGTWDYTYDLFEPITQINGQTYNDVWTVEQADEGTGDPSQSPDIFANRARGVEKYARNIGLVYRQLILWEYEVGQTQPASFTGFGITMWMIDHN